MDFAFYAALSLAFAIVGPVANAQAAATLLASFLMNGAAFLAFSTLAQRKGTETTAQGQKAIYYIAGLAEGGETISVFVAMCLWPQGFSAIAWLFAAVCLASAAARIAQ